jgi:ATP-dependent helicase/nuclease subunit A
MSGMKLVDEDARLRAVEDLDTSLCVEAGAGTGKTTLLVDRYLEIVSSGRARCGQIVAITFTEKAAGEMKFRVRREIEERLARPDLDAGVRARLDEALFELERAPISTIHSFASTLLREHPLEAGVDPRFDLLDEIGSPMFLEECWADFLASIPPRGGEAVRRFLELGGTLARLREIADALYFRRGERNVEAFASGGGSEHVSSDDPAREFADLVRSSAIDLSRIVRDHCTSREDPGCREIERFLAEIGGIEDRLDREDLLLGLSLPAMNKGKKSNWSPKDACGEVKDIVDRLHAGMLGFKSALADRVREELVAWLDGYLELVEARKTARGLLDYDDLLIRTRELLSNPDALSDLRARYRFILVDEFQDTDPLQTEIIFMLSGAAADDDPGKLFVVGDPKQSIYRFRKADVEIYEKIKERLAASGSHLNICQNFRSIPPIVGWVNETFGAIIVPPPEGKYQPRYEPIHAVRPGAGPAVVALDLEFDGEAPKAGEVRRAEGAAIARLVCSLVGSGRTVTDPITKETVPLAYRHIAVIYPGTTGIDYYEDPLRLADIPYIIEGGKLYYTRQEVRDLASAIQAIEDPWDPIALVAALRSPLFGFSDEEIFLFKTAGGALNYLEPGLEDASSFPDMCEAFGLLARLHSGRNAVGPAGTVRELLRETNFLEFSLMRPHGEQRVLNINKILQKARRFESAQVSYRQFARWIGEQEAASSAEAESPLVEEDEDAVRLLTVHKAKGLQFPVVILANLVQRRTYRSSSVLGGGRHVSFKIGKEMMNSDFRDLEEGEKSREEAENARLLYVAATRAMDLLVGPRSPARGSNYFSLIADGLSGGSPLVDSMSVSELPRIERSYKPFRKKPRLGGAGELERWLAGRARTVERASRAPAVVTPSGAVEHGSFGPSGGSDDGRGALSFGSAFHELMELVDLGSEHASAGLCEGVAERYGLEDAEELRSLAARALGSSLLAAVRSSGRFYREVPFTVRLDDMYLEGRIDLLFEAEGSWHIVDYKTDDVPPGQIDSRLEVYRPQGLLYALAAERLGLAPVAEVVFYFARPGEWRAISVEDTILDDFEADLQERFSGSRDSP